MKKFAIRSDMEGLTGVVRQEEVVPGEPGYEKARERLHEEIEAICLGLAEGGADLVEIYDEHYFGLNVEARYLPSGVSVIRGKPPYRVDWCGGVEKDFSGLILQGYHAMTGVKGGVLPHTYEPDIAAIRINGTLVGEIGVEAAVAGDIGVPLAMIIGDVHGVAEAQALVPQVAGVAVKEGMGGATGRCRSWTDVRKEIIEKSKSIAAGNTKAAPLKFEGPINLEIDLFDGRFKEKLQCKYGAWRSAEGVCIQAESVSAAWAQYWLAKDATLALCKAG